MYSSFPLPHGSFAVQAGQTASNIASSLIESNSNTRRALLQTVDTEQLLQQISTIKTQQSQITNDMSSLTVRIACVQGMKDADV